MNNEECKEADEYVRDHLLIQWLMHEMGVSVDNIEDVYDNWMAWLKEMEERNGEGSKIRHLL